MYSLASTFFVGKKVHLLTISQTKIDS